MIRRFFLGFSIISLAFLIGCGSSNSARDGSIMGSNPPAATDSTVSSGTHEQDTGNLANPAAPSDSATSVAAAPAASPSTASDSASSIAPAMPSFLDDRIDYNLFQVSFGSQEIVNFDEWVLDNLGDWCLSSLHKPCDQVMLHDGVPSAWILLYSIHKNTGTAPSVQGTMGAAAGHNPVNVGARLPFAMVQAALGINEIVSFDTWALDAFDSWSRLNLHKPADLAMSQDGVPTVWLQLYLISKTHG